MMESLTDRARKLANTLREAASALDEASDRLDEMCRRFPAVDILSQSVADAQFGFSVRARKTFIRLGVKTIGDLIGKTSDEIMYTRNCGESTLNEIHEVLGKFNLALSDFQR